MTPIHKGKIVQGKPVFDNLSRYLVSLSKLEGQRFELTIKKEKSQRSLNQNGYYHAVVIAILSDFTGYEVDEIHEALKAKFLSLPEDDFGIVKIRSTTELSTVEFEDYLERIRRWATMKLNCFIPLPNEYRY
jgi:hypothetical protein